jgi:hypothetical protein
VQVKCTYLLLLDCYRVEQQLPGKCQLSIQHPCLFADILHHNSDVLHHACAVLCRPLLRKQCCCGQCALTGITAFLSGRHCSRASAAPRGTATSCNQDSGAPHCTGIVRLPAPTPPCDSKQIATDLPLPSNCVYRLPRVGQPHNNPRLTRTRSRQTQRLIFQPGQHPQNSSA